MSLIVVDKFVGGLHSPNVTSDIQLGPSDASDILNVEYYPRGAISKRDGYISYNMSTNPISGVMSLFPWKDASFANVTLAYTTTSGSNISADVYTLTLSGASITTSRVFSAEKYVAAQWSPNLSADEVHVASYGGSAVAVAGGNRPPLVYNTAQASAVPQTTCPSGARYVAAWGQYLFLGNVVASGLRKYARIQWNSGGDIANWPASYYIDLDADDGDQITGMKLLGDYLVVFKKNKIFIVYWQGGALLFKEARRSSTVGCVAGRTIIEQDQKLYFLADDGFYAFDGTNLKELSRKIKDKVFEINLAMPSLHHAVKYEPHRQLWFGVNHLATDIEASDDKRYANRVFVYDYELENWTLYDIPSTAFANILLGTDYYYYDFPEAYSTYTQRIGSYIGTESAIFLIGHAQNTDSSKKSCLSYFGGTNSDVTSGAINSYWQSVWYDLGDPTVNKRFLRWTIVANQESTMADNTLVTELREDYKDATYLLPDGTASSWTLHLTSTDGTRDGLPMEMRIDTSRTCRAFQLKLSNNVYNNAWTLHKFVVDGMPKGRTKVS